MNHPRFVSPFSIMLLALLIACLPAALSFAWIYPEHRDITYMAIRKLDPGRRAVLERLWAEENAESDANEIVKKRQAKFIKDGRLNTNPLRLEEPSVSVKGTDDTSVDNAWVQALNQRFQEEINAVYEAAKQKAEMQLLLRKSFEIDEEDALVALLLTI